MKELKNQLAIMAVGAHPDDIELGCGGSLAKYAQSDARIRAIVFSKGKRGALTDEDRAEETAAAFRSIGVHDVIIHDFEDTRLTYALREMINALDRHVAEFRPDRVYTMFQEDRHQDHRAVYEATAVACRKVPQLIGYETPSSYPNFRPTMFEEIGDQLEAKMTALKCHLSQGERVYMQEEKLRAAAYFRGAQVELGPCEGFVPYRLVF